MNFSINYDKTKYQAIPSIDRGYTPQVIDGNKYRFDCSTSRLKEYKNNSNFYRNRQISGVLYCVLAAPAIVGLAAVCFAAVAAQFARIGTGRSSGMAAGGLTAIPIVAAMAVIGLVAPLFASFNSDTKELADLKEFTRHIESKVADCEQNIQRSNAAMQEEFSEAAWQGMRGISNPSHSYSLARLTTDDKKRAAWLGSQTEISRFRAANASAKARLEAVLARFESRT